MRRRCQDRFLMVNLGGPRCQTCQTLSKEFLRGTFAVPPAFAVPLSAEELKELGTFVAIWSQIDFLAGYLIGVLTSTPQALFFLESTTTGPRINLLKKAASKPPKTRIKSKLVKLCDDNGGLLYQRNHVINGLWAIEWNLDTDHVSAGCTFQKGYEKSIPATKLAILSETAAKFAHDLGKAYRELLRIDDSWPPAPVPYYFGADELPRGRPCPRWPPKSPE
jgi:hypothetical protein